MKDIIKKLLKEGLNEGWSYEDQGYPREIDDIFNEMVNSEDVLELKPIPLLDGLFFKKENNEISVIDPNRGTEVNFNADEYTRLKTYLVSKYFKHNKGQNIKLSKYKREKIKGNELKIGDIYVRDIGGTRYIYKMISKFNKSDKPGYFWSNAVEIMDIGNEEKIISKDPDGTFEVVGHSVGQKSFDSFKNKWSSYHTTKVEFGNVIRLLNF